MDELISRTELLDKVKEVINPADINQYIVWCKLIKIVEELPTIPQTFKPIAEIKVDTDEIVERIKKDMESWKPTIIPQNNYNSAENNYNNAENGNIVDFEDKQTNTAEFEECDNPCIECGGNCCPDEDNDGNIHCKCAKVYFRKEPHTNTAEWKIENNGGTTMWYECSACGNAGDKWDKYCKHCGRKMTNAVAE